MRRTAAAVLGVWTVLALTACGGGSGSLPAADGSRTAPVRPSVTVSLPSRAPSSPAGPTSGPPTSTAPPRSSAPTSSAPTSTAPTSTAPTSTAPTSTAPTSTAPTSPAPTSTAPPAQPKDQSEPAADDGGIPSWVWWVLVAVGLAAAGAAAILVPRARKRSAWRADLAAAEGEVAWFARGLLPQLQQGRSVDEVAGGWQIAQGRVTAVEDRLTGLESTAPDEAGTARARELRDAVRDARRGVETLVATRSDPFFARELGAITAALTAVLEPAAPSS
jgi:hypothetical protein